MPRCKISDPEFANNPEPIPLAEAIENAFQDWTLVQGTLSLRTSCSAWYFLGNTSRSKEWHKIDDKKLGPFVVDAEIGPNA